MRTIFAIAIIAGALASTGCGKYVGKAYGSSGKTYQAPELCQAVAKCAAAGENKCFYPQNDTYRCEATK